MQSVEPAAPRVGALRGVGLAVSPRLWAAIAAAVALHAGVIAATRMTWRPGSAAAVPRVLSVRYLEAVPAHALGAPVEPAAAPAERAPAEALARPDAAPAAATPPPAAVARAIAAAVAAPTDRAPAATVVPPVAALPHRDTPPSPDVPSALPPAPDYLVGMMLDPRPQPVGDIEPLYPDSANLQEGTVVLRLLISDTGHVDDVGVVRSEPKGVFEEAATEAFGKAQFTPGRAAGIAVKSQITVEVHFIPINRGSRISGRTY